jgi:hypothetical protein
MEAPNDGVDTTAAPPVTASRKIALANAAVAFAASCALTTVVGVVTRSDDGDSLGPAGNNASNKLNATASSGEEAPDASLLAWTLLLMFLTVALLLPVVYGVRRAKDLQLDTVRHSMLVSSCVASDDTLLLVRCTLLGFMCTTTVSMMLSMGPGMFNFFTNWGYFLLNFYFLSVVVYSLLRYGEVDIDDLPSSAWQQVLWLHFEVAGMVAIFIDVVLWGVLWPQSGFDSFLFQPMMLDVHGANLVCVLVELYLNKLNVERSHCACVSLPCACCCLP